MIEENENLGFCSEILVMTLSSVKCNNLRSMYLMIVEIVKNGILRFWS